MIATRCYLVILVLVSALATGLAQTTPPAPEKNPEGDTGALKPQITTGGSYDAHSGNATRSVEDLRVPGALGVYGLDLTRHWNSIPVDHGNPYAVLPTSFGTSQWTHSWEWSATYAEEGPDQDAEGGGAEGTQRWTTSITITFPDGHANKYKITRVNRNYPGHPANPGWGPPYSTAEQNGFLTGGSVYDSLSDMAADGSEFWLYRADGGAVHFTNDLATEVYDPHGLKTSLIYNGPQGQLSDVIQEGGRSLHFTWGDFGTLGWAITSINTAGPCGYQAVSYGYTTASSPSGMGWLVLATVSYPNEPSVGQTATASYFYDCYYDLMSGNPSLYPMLKSAYDPHYAGAMTKIHYSYRGTECLHDTASQHPDFYGSPKEAIAQELSPTWDVVSSFSIDCLNGTRTERNGLNGWRLFNYGRSAGQLGYYHCVAYQLAKLTDFTNHATYDGVPDERQSFMNGQPREIWDGRRIKTEAVVTPGDFSGKPGEIRHFLADNTTVESFQTFNRVDPGASDQRDPTRIPNRYDRWLFSHKDERGIWTVYKRDSRRRVVDIYYGDTSSEHFTYNAYNQVETHTLPSMVNGQHPVVHYDYDANQRLWREWNDVDGVDNAIIYTYDALERVETVSQPWSRVKGAAFAVKLTYNGRHKVVREEYPATNPGANPFKTYTYDAYGNCTFITDELGHTSSYSYDDYRRCTSYEEPVNAPDGFGNTISTRRWDWIYDRWIVDIGWFGPYTHTGKDWRIQIEPAFNTVGDRRMSARAHDLQGRVLYEWTGWYSDANGNWYRGPDEEVHSFLYDENGQKRSYTDPRGRETTYEYDLRNRLWKTHEPMNRTTETLYDVTGNKTMVKFPVEDAGQRTQQWLDYTPFGQAERFIDERGNTTNLNHQWGPMKKLLSVVTHRTRDDGGTEDQTTTFTYDGTGRPKQVLFPDGSHEDSSYLYAQLHTWSTRKGQGKTFDYDARGREISHVWNDGQTPGINRHWDNAGRMDSISNAVATINYGYDDASQVRFESESIAGAGGPAAVGYRRYPNGSIWRLVYPNGMEVARSYTARGQLDGVWDNGPNNFRQVIDYNYYPDGKVEHQDYGNGTTTAFGYDDRGMISSVSHRKTANNQNLSYREYYRDNRDRIYAWKKSTDSSVNPMEDGRGDRYEYDPEGQLTRAFYGVPNPQANPDGYVSDDNFYSGYDELGNRKTWNWQALWGFNWYGRRNNGLNQYTDWTPSIMYYDDNSPWPGYNGFPGNGVMMADGWVAASFNALNQPIAIWSKAYQGRVPDVYSWFGYDPLGRCVKRWVDAVDGSAPSGVTYLYYDGWNLIQEGPSAYTADRQYVHGARVDEIVKQITPGNGWERFFHYDARTHCTLQTELSGNIIEQYSYGAFGQPHFYDAAGNEIGYSPWGNRFLFTGREWLSDLKLYDYRNRLYQPELGRFLQPDPKEFEAGDYNLYRYCHNDPVNKSDPTGQFFVVDDIAEVYAAVAIGAAATAYLSSPAGQKMIQDFGRAGLNAIRSLQDALHNSDSGVKDIPDKFPPPRGDPGSTVRGGEQTRRYGPDGYPDVDRDRPHPGDKPPGNADHAHDWTRPPGGGPPKGPKGEDNPYRGDHRVPKPDDPPPPRNHPLEKSGS
jgi:RHS repeat-associated protein